VGRTLAGLEAQLAESDELIVVDNASADGTADAVRELAPGATVIEAGENLGFAAGSNRGAATASGELLCFLNPDAVPQDGWRDAIAAPAEEGRGWAAWQGLVTAERGAEVNTAGGVVHFTGIAWAGEATEAPGFVSGACLAIGRERFQELGGFAEDFFLYHEDVDLSLRIRLRGGRLGVETAARADHEYEFAKGPAKWRYLERNRWATLIRTYPLALLLLIAPALVATELALVVVALRGGWMGQKLGAWADALRRLPQLLRERREIQGTSEIGPGEFAAALTADLNSPYLGAPGRSPLLRRLLRAYWGVVVRLLGAGGLAG